VICTERESSGSAVSLTSALDGAGGHLHAPAALPPAKRAGAHFTGGGVVPGADLGGFGGENSVHAAGFESRTVQPRSELLYRQSYPGPRLHSSPPIYRPQVTVTYSRLRIEFGVSVTVG
jgi:hypothetical protein